MKTFKELKKEITPEKILYFFAHFKSGKHPEHNIENNAGKETDFFAHFKSGKHPEHNIDEKILVPVRQRKTFKPELLKHLAGVKHHSKIPTPAADRKAVSNYTNISHGLNSGLIKNTIKEHRKNQVNSLDRVTTDKRNALNSPIKAYSGVSGRFGSMLRNIKKDGIVSSPAFISTSLNHKIAKGFAHEEWDAHKGVEYRNVLVFHLPKGFHKGRHISHLSAYDSGKTKEAPDISPDDKEHEFLMARNQEFKKIGETTRKLAGDQHMMYHHVAPIDK